MSTERVRQRSFDELDWVVSVSSGGWGEFFDYLRGVVEKERGQMRLPLVFEARGDEELSEVGDVDEEEEMNRAAAVAEHYEDLYGSLGYER